LNKQLDWVVKPISARECNNHNRRKEGSQARQGKDEAGKEDCRQG